MKLTINGTPEELASKSDLLIKKLQDLFGEISPDVAERLEKALPHKEKPLKFPVLQDMLGIVEGEYEKHMKKMISEIGKVLRSPMKKSEVTDGGNVVRFQDHTADIADKDGRAYDKVKVELVGMGWMEADFLEGGAFDGWSTNELIDFTRNKKSVAE